MANLGASYHQNNQIVCCGHMFWGAIISPEGHIFLGQYIISPTGNKLPHGYGAVYRADGTVCVGWWDRGDEDDECFFYIKRRNARPYIYIVVGRRELEVEGAVCIERSQVRVSDNGLVHVTYVDPDGSVHSERFFLSESDFFGREISPDGTTNIYFTVQGPDGEEYIYDNVAEEDLCVGRSSVRATLEGEVHVTYVYSDGRVETDQFWLPGYYEEAGLGDEPLQGAIPCK